MKKCVFLMFLSLAICFVANEVVSASETFVTGITEVAGTIEVAPAIAAAVVALPVVAGFDVSKLKCMSAEEFGALKDRYGRLFVIDVLIDDDESYQFILKRPCRAITLAVADLGDNFEAVNDLIIKNLLVGGDKDALDDGIVYNAFMRQVGKVMEQGKSFFTKA